MAQNVGYKSECDEAIYDDRNFWLTIASEKKKRSPHGSNEILEGC